MHPMVLLGDEAQAKACFGPFEDIILFCPFGDTDNLDAS
jgi:hypothetical protein